MGDRIMLARRRGIAASPELVKLRQQVGGAVARYPRHPDVDVDYKRWSGVRCLVLTPRSPDRRMLYFHGGGFRIGSPEIAAGFTSHLAARSNCRIVLPFYGLAPENPFPGALHDGQTVLEALLGEEQQPIRGESGREPIAGMKAQQLSNSPLLIGGDSAGGNLAAVLARRFANHIAGVLLLSPWLDLRIQADSYDVNSERDKVFSKTAARDAAELYLQGHSSLDADVSPLLGKLSGMPPAFIAVGGSEVLLDDSVAFARQLDALHRPVSLLVLPDMAHVEATLNPHSKNTAEVLERASALVRRWHCPTGKFP